MLNTRISNILSVLNKVVYSVWHFWDIIGLCMLVVFRNLF